MVSTTFFMLARTPAVACCWYCIGAVGHSFDYPGFIANHIEVQGPDIGIMSSYSNTVNWVLVLGLGQLFALMKRRTGSWLPLFGGPVVVRGLSGVYYLMYASIHSARSAMEENVGGNR